MVDVDALWRELAHCPGAAVYWASLAYRAGEVSGYEQRDRELAADLAGATAAWRADLIAAGWRPGQPSHAELQSRRVATFEPCAAGCSRCSRCVAAFAWQERGGRPYLGIEREADLRARRRST